MQPKSLSMLVAVSAIFIGAILLLGNMGAIPSHLVGMWPVVLIVAGLVGICCLDPEKMKSTSSSKKNSKKK